MLIFTTANIRDSKSKISFEADRSQILDPIVNYLFSSTQILIFNESPNLFDVPSEYLKSLSIL